MAKHDSKSFWGFWPVLVQRALGHPGGEGPAAEQEGRPRPQDAATRNTEVGIVGVGGSLFTK